MNQDTIAAISTAISNSGISIIRVSGDDAISICSTVFADAKFQKSLSSYKANTIHFGYIVDKDESIIDEVMVSVMKAPKSYTTEDTVEINCHGGIYVTGKILDRVLEAGARPAQPGEFTKRAFLGGRIDLTRAEAVMDVISSKSEFALSSSIKQLGGALYNKIKTLREDILYEIAFIESALDDPEHISLVDYPDTLCTKIDTLTSEVSRLLATADDGIMLREGISAVIVGKTNAGKSSVLNRLLGVDKAIVTDIAGTTRDTIEEFVRIKDIPVNITDTAGIRESSDIVEKIGIEKAVNLAQKADLIIYVIDSSSELNDEDDDIFKLVSDKKTIVLMNKSDLSEKLTEKELMDRMKSFSENFSSENVKFIHTSVVDDSGFDSFADALEDFFISGKVTYNDEVFITSKRHKDLLSKTLDSLGLVKKSISTNLPEDFFSIDLMNAYTFLGNIIGEEVEDDLADKIFSTFCMGK